MKSQIKFIGTTVMVTATLLLSSCNDDFLEQLPETEIGAEKFFNTEEDLSIYVNGLYNFPGIGLYSEDEATDNMATTGNREIKTLMTTDANSTTITSGWGWGTLRDINFFLEHVENANVTDEIRNHYIGVARFFRANFYMEKVKRFSNVPWYDTVLGTSDEELLFKTSDPRQFVVDKIMEDYQFAFDNVMEEVPDGAINKWVVGTYYGRNALYEGTFRKYHGELGLESSAIALLQLASQISQVIMDNGAYSIYTSGNPQDDYLSLFESMDLSGNPEVILANYFEMDVKNAGDPQYMFGSYEGGPARDLVTAYLMEDGSYFSEQPNSDTMTFVEEFASRDPRLSQTYSFPGWQLEYTSTYSPGSLNYVQELKKNFTGYHQIKGFANSASFDVRANIDIPVLRYAEVLLINAEAKAELGIINQGDLDQTINLLRDRVGMPHLTMSVATDSYQAEKYPLVTNPVLLEIRRERRVELAMEGRRLDDLNRWAAGKVLEEEPVGMYFPSLGKFDLTGDGIEDIILLGESESVPDPKEENSLGVPYVYYVTGQIGSISADVYLTNGTSGHIIATPERGIFQEPKHYYRPIPATEVTLNPALEQIFGWD
ncbi:RagB/SusD family nutrient uptake outer membrane protein [Cytophaga sp. FL35]|uniref:RagB/SusD family nutrient uptake outer membrane protein n=1 Tax=Cytophaga sp. FL35 TaxID=1904456 RepID=UPI001653BB31|nr:RagB/SusD family nutrient uptake outer membrane protein [Cytophaga sp. FL35]MBC7000790.1 RagB/SusD family nutrient uptake outer membrane protein [Cytophaga sp. FL35]